MDKPKIGETWKIISGWDTLIGLTGVIVEPEKHQLYGAFPFAEDEFSIDLGADLGVWLVTLAELERVDML